MQKKVHDESNHPAVLDASLQKCGGGWLGRRKPASSRILMIMVGVPQRKLSLESPSIYSLPLPSKPPLASPLSKKILQIAMLAARSPLEVSPPTIIKRSKPHPSCIAVAVLNAVVILPGVPESGHIYFESL